MEKSESYNWDEHDNEGQQVHPPPELIMLAVDGELAPAEAKPVAAHLAACWVCRTHSAKIEATITDFMEYYQTMLKPQLAPPPNIWRDFHRHLERRAEEIGPPSWLSRLGGRLRELFAARRTVWRFAVGVAALFVLVLGFWMSRSPVVSAQELLQRSMQAETAGLQLVAEPVLYRKLQVRRQAAGATEAVTWESWRAIKGKLFRQRVADQEEPRSGRDVERTPPLLSELAQVLQRNHLDAQRPLSAVAFAEWRTRIRPSAEAVTESKEGLTLTIHVAAPQARQAIKEASLLVRKSDWHAVALSLHVQFEGEVRTYELREAAYEVLPLGALTVFADLAPPPLLLPAPTATATPMVAPSRLATETSPTLPPSAPLPTAAALQEAEVAALYALHQAQADLGEQIEVRREDHKQVVVRGLVQSATRKEELLQALRRLPLVSPQLLTIDEAVQQAQRAAVPKNNETVSATNETAVTSAATAPNVNAFQQWLIEQFGGRKGMNEAEREAVNARVTQFYNGVEADASAALAEAWALRRLQERFATTSAPDLDAASRQRLDEMLGNHTTRLRQRVRNLQARLRPQLVALVHEVPTVAPAAEATRPAKIQAAFRGVEQVSRLTDQLIAGQNAPSLSQTARALLTAFTRLDAVLSDLEKN